MDELEAKYQGKIEFTRIDVNTTEGACEFQKQGFTHIPAMIYINSEGDQQATTEEYQDLGQLDQRLQDLLGG